MIFLFEEHPYDSEFLKEAIGHSEGDLKYRSKSGFNTETTQDGVKINGVGYCFYNGQPVFVLPKVFLDENGQKAFGENINPKGEDCFGNQKEDRSISKEQRKFFSSISLWLYSAIDKYNKNSDSNKDNGVATPPQSESRNFKKNDRYATLLDIMSSMELFYKKNQSLFVFVAKNKHSGNHKINWQRTVNKKTPFIQDGVPIYMDPVKKAKVFDLDDRLLVLYFSAMRFIQDQFGYTMPQSEFYQPLRMNEMERLLENERGLRELKKIKYKYFEDRLLKLYNIMEAFFRWGACYKNKNNNAQEYLIANSFNNVFEAMIDELIGDPEFADLKNNDDGKIIDHLYKEKSLMYASGESNKIWHIGDSKYYKHPEDIKGKSIYKQFTYAKNVMQNFFSSKYIEEMSRDADAHRGVRYRDDLTDGYNITPNFFIRGDVPKFSNESQYVSDYFQPRNEKIELVKLAKYKDENGQETEEAMMNHLWSIRNRHFKNRLFDRDTLLLQIYDVNFLYVLNAYTSKRSTLREEFKHDARDKFRKNFILLLDKKFNFYKIIPQGLDLNAFVTHRFRRWIGKMYCPEDVPDDQKTFIIYAEEKESEELLNETTSNEKRRVIDNDEFICLPLSAQSVLDAAADRELNPDIFTIESSLELLDRIEHEGVVELPKQQVFPNQQTSVPKYLLALGDDAAEIHLFIVLSVADSSDTFVCLHVLEQNSYVQRVFDCDEILENKVNLVNQRMKWNDLPWRSTV